MLNKDKQEEESIYIPLKEYEKLVSDFKNSIKENDYIKQQLAELKRMIFGRKSEKMSPIPGQPTLFDLDYQEEAIPETKEITYTKTATQKEKNKPVRK